MAKNGLRNLGLSEPQVFSGDDRSPIWPSGFLGSITHCDDRALAIVGEVGHYEYMGIDCERVFLTETVREVRRMIITASEEAGLVREEIPLAHMVTLAFSAKEALFKALYPYILNYFDFDAVEITGICIKDLSFILVLRKAIAPTLPKGTEFRGFFLFERDIVLTLLLR